MDSQVHFSILKYVLLYDREKLVQIANFEKTKKLLSQKSLIEYKIRLLPLAIKTTFT